MPQFPLWETSPLPWSISGILGFSVLSFDREPGPLIIPGGLPAPGLTFCHMARVQLIRRAVCCHDRYSSTRARACRSWGYQWSGASYLRARYSRMATLGGMGGAGDMPQSLFSHSTGTRPWVRPGPDRTHLSPGPVGGASQRLPGCGTQTVMRGPERSGGSQGHTALHWAI